MLTIRHRYHYGSVVLNENGVLFGHSVIDNKIAVLLRSGETAYHPYLGAANLVPLPNLKKVKIVNLNGYTFDRDGLFNWIQVPKHHYVVGVWMNGGVYILLKNDHPILFGMDKC